MKKRLKRLGLFTVILVALCALFLGEEHFRGRHSLNVRLAELKTKGEKLTIGELEPRHPPADQNAALALLVLTNQISQLHSNQLDLPPFGRFAAPGRRMIAWQLETWSGNKKTNDWQHVGQTMEKSQAVLLAIHAALQKPDWDGGFDYRKGFGDFQSPPLVDFKRASLVLIAAATWELKQGRTNEAIGRAADAVRLVRLQKDECLIISQLVRIACAALAWNNSWELLQTNAWSDAQLATLQATWQDMDFTADMGRAMEMERAMTLEYLREVSGSWEKLDSFIKQQEECEEMFGDGFTSLPTHGPILRWVHAPLWRWAWMDQDARRALDRWQELIEAYRLAQNKSWTAAKDRAGRLDTEMEEGPWMRTQNEESKPNIYNRWRYLLSNQPFGVGGSMVRRVVETETTRRMMVTALALKRYHLRHGQPAATLDALVPELLPAVPVDGMDGKPLRYRPTPDGTFLLYSVGEDGRDDGGDFSLVSGKTRYSQIWDGKDAVWPSPASREEAAKAAFRK